MEKKDQLTIIVTHGCEDPERASLPFVCANAALAMETHAIVVLQGTSVVLAKKGCYEHVFAAGIDSLKKLVDTFVELGGELWVCTPCIRERHITEEMLIEQAKPVTAGAVVMACMESQATLNY